MRRETLYSILSSTGSQCSDWGDMIIFAHPHQDPSSAVLNVLELLDAFVEDPDEECIAVVQPGGDKGVDQLFGIRQSECGAEFGDVPEVIKAVLAQLFNVGLNGQMGIHLYPNIVIISYHPNT